MYAFHPGVERWRKPIAKLLEGGDLPLNLVMAMVEQESRGFEFAQSSAGAKGLLQLTSIAIRDIGRDDKTFDFWDPEENLKAGITYMAKMMNRFDGNVSLALAAYNAGPGNVAKYQNTVPPFRETKNYVALITARLNAINRWEEKNKPPEPKEEPPPSKPKAKRTIFGKGGI
jgi:soluble lytic murein transglycosylase-like protein